MFKVFVIGAGAMGSLYGGKLAQAGVRVSLLCRSDYEAVKENGINVKSRGDIIGGDFHFMPHSVVRDVRDYKEQPDFILICTKALPEISLPDLIAPILAPNSTIVLMQNGIHIEKSLIKAFPNNPLTSIIAFVCVSKTEFGVIDHQDYGKIIVGDFPQGVSPKTMHLIDLWKKSGVPCEATVEIQVQRWRKLTWNAAFNPISVMAGGLDTEEMLQNEALLELAKSVMKEVCILAEADGCKLPEDIIEKNIELTRKMKPYKTSMLLDFEAQKKMEIEAILGNAINFAKSKSIAVPHLTGLYGLLNSSFA